MSEKGWLKVKITQYSLLLSFLILLLSMSVVAATNCNPPTNGDWIFNSTNSTLICDNGTAIDLGTNYLILNDNATVTFTNGTRLNASNILINSTNASLFVNESSNLTTILDMVSGNATIIDTTLNGNPILTGGILTLTNATIISSTLTTNATIITNNMTLTALYLNIAGANYTGTNTNITTLTNNGTATITGGTITTITNTQTITLANTNTTNLTSTGNVTLDNATVSTLSTNATITATNSTLTNLTLNSTGAQYTGTDSDVTILNNNGTIVVTDGTITTLTNNGNASTTNTHITTLVNNGENFTATGGNIDSITNTLMIFLTNTATISLVSTGNATLDNATISGDANTTMMIAVNSSFGTLRLTPGSDSNLTNSIITNLTMTVTNATIYNIVKGVSSTGNISSNVTTNVNTLFVNTTITNLILNTTGTTTATNLTLTNLTTRGDLTATSLNAENLSLLSNSTSEFTTTNISTLSFDSQNESVIMKGNTTLTTVNFQENLTLTRVYPLSVNYSSGSPFATKSIRVLTDSSDWSSAVWSGTTDANGYAEPNITFNSSNYNDTFYLAVKTGGLLQTTALKLLNDTPINWTLRALPILSLTTTSGSIGSGTFGFNVTFSNDTVNATYAITNGTVWTNGSWNATQLSVASWSFEKSFDGLYLPTGLWTLNVTASNGSTNHSETTSLTSIAAMQTTLTSAASQSATIGGSAVGFTFNITAKGAGSEIGAFLNLTAGSTTYNASHALLVKGNVSVNVSGSPLYTGAGNVTLGVINATPSYILLNFNDDGSIVNGLVTLSITPYSGLVAGTYGGTYGFGVLG